MVLDRVRRSSVTPLSCTAVSCRTPASYVTAKAWTQPFTLDYVVSLNKYPTSLCKPRKTRQKSLHSYKKTAKNPKIMKLNGKARSKEVNNYGTTTRNQIHGPFLHKTGQFRMPSPRSQTAHQNHRLVGDSGFYYTVHDEKIPSLAPIKRANGYSFR